MAENIKTLEEFVLKGNFGSEPMKLRKGETITNRKKFAESHLFILKSNPGKKLFLSFYERLAKFKKIIENERLKS
jgi:hypothetical protein